MFNEEAILYADLDLADVTRSRLDFDAVGHSARPDVLNLVVNERPQLPVTFVGDKRAPAEADE